MERLIKLGYGSLYCVTEELIYLRSRVFVKVLAKTEMNTTIKIIEQNPPINVSYSGSPSYRKETSFENRSNFLIAFLALLSFISFFLFGEIIGRICKNQTSWNINFISRYYKHPRPSFPKVKTIYSFKDRNRRDHIFIFIERKYMDSKNKIQFAKFSNRKLISPILNWWSHNSKESVMKYFVIFLKNRKLRPIKHK